MMKEKIIFVAALVALAWIIVSYIRKKRLKDLYLAILFAGTLLWWYPFRLPPEAGFTVWSALGSWIVFREPSRKNPGSPLTLVGVMLITFALIFLSKTLLDMKIL
jgi:hypothetical protein